MRSENEPEPTPSSTDPDELARALELELKLKRAAWQRTRANRGTWRTLSILFVLLVLFAALLAFFFVLPQLRSRAGEREHPPAQNSGR